MGSCNALKFEMNLVSVEKDIAISPLINLMDKKKSVKFSKCVHLQRNFKYHILGVPYPWPGVTKFNVSIFVLGLWGREYWSKMEILVTQTPKFSESCCRDLEITWCIWGNNTEQLKSSVALVTYQAWCSVFHSGQVSVLKVSTSQSNTKTAIKTL